MGVQQSQKLIRVSHGSAVQLALHVRRDQSNVPLKMDRRSSHGSSGRLCPDASLRLWFRDGQPASGSKNRGARLLPPAVGQRTRTRTTPGRICSRCCSLPFSTKLQEVSVDFSGSDLAAFIHSRVGLRQTFRKLWRFLPTENTQMTLYLCPFNGRHTVEFSFDFLDAHRANLVGSIISRKSNFAAHGVTCEAYDI